MNPFIASLIRTIVPIVVGSILGLLAKVGLDIDVEGQQALSTLIDSACIGGYYIVVRLIETKVPQVGWLLGLAKSPDSYSQDGTVPVDEQRADLEDRLVRLEGDGLYASGKTKIAPSTAKHR